MFLPKPRINPENRRFIFFAPEEYVDIDSLLVACDVEDIEIDDVIDIEELFERDDDIDMENFAVELAESYAVFASQELIKSVASINTENFNLVVNLFNIRSRHFVETFVDQVIDWHSSSRNISKNSKMIFYSSIEFEADPFNSLTAAHELVWYDDLDQKSRDDMLSQIHSRVYDENFLQYSPVITTLSAGNNLILSTSGVHIEADTSSSDVDAKCEVLYSLRNISELAASRINQGEFSELFENSLNVYLKEIAKDSPSALLMESIGCVLFDAFIPLGTLDPSIVAFLGEMKKLNLAYVRMSKSWRKKQMFVDELATGSAGVVVKSRAILDVFEEGSADGRVDIELLEQLKALNEVTSYVDQTSDQTALDKKDFEWRGVVESTLKTAGQGIKKLETTGKAADGLVKIFVLLEKIVAFWNKFSP